MTKSSRELLDSTRDPDYDFQCKDIIARSACRKDLVTLFNDPNLNKYKYRSYLINLGLERLKNKKTSTRHITLMIKAICAFDKAVYEFHAADSTLSSKMKEQKIGICYYGLYTFAKSLNDLTFIVPSIISRLRGSDPLACPDPNTIQAFTPKLNVDSLDLNINLYVDEFTEIRLLRRDPYRKKMAEAMLSELVRTANSLGHLTKICDFACEMKDYFKFAQPDCRFTTNLHHVDHWQSVCNVISTKLEHLTKDKNNEDSQKIWESIEDRIKEPLEGNPYQYSEKHRASNTSSPC